MSNFSADLMKRKQAFTLSLGLQMSKPILRKAIVCGQSGGPHSLQGVLPTPQLVDVSSPQAGLGILFPILGRTFLSLSSLFCDPLGGLREPVR